MESELIVSGSKTKITPMEAAVARAVAFAISLDGYQSWSGFIESLKDANEEEASLLEKLYLAEVMASPVEYN